jgi:hypothetical protein
MKESRYWDVSEMIPLFLTLPAPLGWVGQSTTEVHWVMGVNKDGTLPKLPIFEYYTDGKETSSR